MATTWDSQMQERFERLELSVDSLSKKFDTIDSRMAGLDQRLEAIELRVGVGFDNVRDDIRKLGEGYEAGMDGISRKLTDITDSWASRWSVHDSAIRDHEKRLKRLET